MLKELVQCPTGNVTMNSKFVLLLFLPFISGYGDVLQTILNKFSLIFNGLLNVNGIDVDLIKIQHLEKEYDFVVVGSGSAGSVIASRLSEHPEWKILLLEVGKTESSFASVPLFAPLLQISDYNWAYLMEPQDNFCLGMIDQRCAWPRGRALGGSSVINYMIYTRGNRNDYDNWASAGNPGWSYNEVLPYFLKSEDVHLKSKLDKKYHRRGGYLSISNVFKSATTDAFLKAAQQLGATILDYNGKEQNGFSYMQATVKKGRRHSVARAFLEPAKGRRNLHILTTARATKILFEGNKATSIDFIYRKKFYRVKASKEIILSAGAFNSPQLLMLSGIGPKTHLQKYNIPLIKDLPVGKNLQDHISYVGLTFLINQTVEIPWHVFDPQRIARWSRTGEGPLSSLGGIEAIGYIKTKYASNFSADIELIFVGGGAHQSDYGLFNRKFIRISDEYYDKTYKPIEGIPSWTIFPMLLHPKSSGYLELKSTNPLDYPLFYGNYFSHPDDKKVLIESIKFCIKLSKTQAFQKYNSTLSPVRVPGCEHFKENSDEYWDCALERFSITLHHQVGTCKMGPNDVVGADLKVHGIKGLRVADTSIIPKALSAHTNAPSIMIGEKAADLIKTEWGVI